LVPLIDLIGSIRFLVVYRWDNAGVQLATILARRYYADAQPVGAPFQVDSSDMPSTIALQVSEIRFGCETKKTSKLINSPFYRINPYLRQLGWRGTDWLCR
jgi:hypothetical protein